MTGADRTISWSTAAAVVGVAVVAAVVSYEHAYALVHAHGEAGWTAQLIPLTVDGLIWASSMVMLDSARRGCAGVGPYTTPTTAHAGGRAMLNRGQNPVVSQGGD